VVLTSDSKYVVEAINQGWARRWRSKGWMLSPSKPAKNSDLWKILLELCAKHEVRFEWVKGHGGHPQNERCDALAVAASQLNELPADLGFENSAPAVPVEDLFGI
jgi:ribonuclease HI